MEIHRALASPRSRHGSCFNVLRLALQDEFFGAKLGGPDSEVEVDETFIGGKARNMHKDRKAMP